jgi:hypothetical protein
MPGKLNLTRFSARGIGSHIVLPICIRHTILRPDRLRKRYKPSKRPAPSARRAPAIFLVPLEQPLDAMLAVQVPKRLTGAVHLGPLAALWLVPFPDFLAGRHGLAPPDRKYLCRRHTPYKPIEMLAPALQSNSHFRDEGMPLVRRDDAPESAGPVRKDLLNYRHCDTKRSQL